MQVKEKAPLSWQIPGLRSVEEEIERLAGLEEDWDEEGALAVNQDCVHRARTFVRQLDCQESTPDTVPVLPSVYASVDGGVQLYWFTERGQTSLTFRPGVLAIDIQEKERNSPASHHSAGVEEAIQIALRAMYHA
jgi:hypothetical protein